MVFHEPFNCYSFTTFEDIFDIRFFEALKELTQTSSFHFTVIDPALSDDTITFDTKTQTGEDYFGALAKDHPKEQQPLQDLSNIYLYANICLIFSNSVEWAIYAERDTDAAIIGFKNVTLKNQFDQTLKERILNKGELFEIIGQAWGGVQYLPPGFKETFEKAYCQ